MRIKRWFCRRGRFCMFFWGAFFCCGWLVVVGGVGGVFGCFVGSKNLRKKGFRGHFSGLVSFRFVNASGGVVGRERGGTCRASAWASAL